MRGNEDSALEMELAVMVLHEEVNLILKFRGD